MKKWISRFAPYYQGENQKEINLGIFDEILGIVLGFIFLDTFISLDVNSIFDFFLKPPPGKSWTNT